MTLAFAVSAVETTQQMGTKTTKSSCINDLKENKKCLVIGATDDKHVSSTDFSSKNIDTLDILGSTRKEGNHIQGDITKSEITNGRFKIYDKIVWEKLAIQVDGNLKYLSDCLKSSEKDLVQALENTIKMLAKGGTLIILPTTDFRFSYLPENTFTPLTGFIHPISQEELCLLNAHLPPTKDIAEFLEKCSRPSADLRTLSQEELCLLNAHFNSTIADPRIRELASKNSKADKDIAEFVNFMKKSADHNTAIGLKREISVSSFLYNLCVKRCKESVVCPSVREYSNYLFLKNSVVPVLERFDGLESPKIEYGLIPDRSDKMHGFFLTCDKKQTSVMKE